MSTNLNLILDLVRARTLLVRDVDHPLGSHHGLGLNDLAVLLELKAAPSQTLRRVELARRLAVTTSGIARQLAPLEKIGLVTRESNPSDARLPLLVLTPPAAGGGGEGRATAQGRVSRSSCSLLAGPRWRRRRAPPPRRQLRSRSRGSGRRRSARRSLRSCSARPQTDRGGGGRGQARPPRPSL